MAPEDVKKRLDALHTELSVIREKISDADALTTVRIGEFEKRMKMMAESVDKAKRHIERRMRLLGLTSAFGVPIALLSLIWWVYTGVVPRVNKAADAAILSVNWNEKAMAAADKIDWKARASAAAEKVNWDALAKEAESRIDWEAKANAAAERVKWDAIADQAVREIDWNKYAITAATNVDYDSMAKKHAERVTEKMNTELNALETSILERITSAEGRLEERVTLGLGQVEEELNEIRKKVGEKNVPGLLLKRALDHTCDSGARCNALQQLGELRYGGNRTIPFLILELPEADDAVASCLLEALVVLGRTVASPDVAKVLLERAIDQAGDADARCKALQLLSQLGYASDLLIPALVRALADENCTTKKCLISALKKFNRDETVHELVKVLLARDTGWDLRNAVREVCANTFPRSTVVDLFNALGEDGEESKEARRTLDEMKPRIVMRVIKRRLLGENPEYRPIAKKYLLDRNKWENDLASVLGWLRQVEDEEVKHLVSENDRLQVPILIDKLSMGDPDEVIDAASSLEEIGKLAKPALTKLRELAANDLDADVRLFCKEAIEAITGELDGTREE